MTFCLKLGTEIETLFREILNDKKFDSVPDIEKSRTNQKEVVFHGILLKILLEIKSEKIAIFLNSLIYLVLKMVNNRVM